MRLLLNHVTLQVVLISSVNRNFPLFIYRPLLPPVGGAQLQQVNG